MLSSRLYFPALIVFMLWGCSGGQEGPTRGEAHVDKTQSAATTPPYTISFEKSRIFGSTDEHLVGIRGHHNVITDEKNHVYIPDSPSNVIHVFDSTGRYITQMGGEGRGPGEYLHMSDFQITPDYLYIYGRTLFKITAYSLQNLSYSNTILFTKESWKDVEQLYKRTVGSNFFATDDGEILMEFYYVTEFDPEQWEREESIKNHTVQWYWLNPKGIVISDMVFEQQRKKRHIGDGWGAKTTMTFDFFGEPLQAMTNDGTIAAAQSTEFKISLYDSDGSPKNVIEFPFEKTPLNRETLIKDYKRRFNNGGLRLKPYKTMDLPDNWPALDEIFFDDENRLWVSAIVPNLDVYEWFIFNMGGQLLARFSWPRDKPIQEIKNSFMYTSEDNEQGIREIIRYKIVMDKIEN